MVYSNLADSLNIISKEDFLRAVKNAKTATIASMSSWKANPKVMQGRDQLYSYLKTAVDAAIGLEKPKKTKK